MAVSSSSDAGSSLNSIGRGRRAGVVGAEMMSKAPSVVTGGDGAVGWLRCRKVQSGFVYLSPSHTKLNATMRPLLTWRNRSKDFGEGTRDDRGIIARFEEKNH